MSVIVTDTGFGTDKMTGMDVLNIPSDTDPAALVQSLPTQPVVRIEFSSSADGRGFSIASRLRRAGFAGHLRAAGIIADQYAMARRSGFDDVEVDDDLAKRQPEDQWLARANWQAHNYQARLRGDAANL